MYKILTYTPVWQRPEIFSICLKGIKRLVNYKPEKFQIQPFFVVSPGDNKNIEQLKKYKFSYVVYQNLPLGEKKNYGLNYAMKHFDFDYMLEIGSDDLITSSYLDFVEPELKAKTPQFNISCCYFIDTVTGKVAFWQSDIIIGLGRMFSKQAIDKTLSVPFVFNQGMAGPNVSYTPKQTYYLPLKSAKHYQACDLGKITGTKDYQLWNNHSNSGMDTYSMRNFERAGVKNKVLKTNQVFTLDIKSEQNINKINLFDKPSPFTKTEVLKHFPEATQIRKLIKNNAAGPIK